MKTSYLWILLSLAAIISTSAIVYRSQQGSPSREVFPSEQYEFWSIDLDGRFHHSKCKGDFKSKYKLYVLFQGSLSKLLAIPPTQTKMKIEAEASYIGQEEVLEQSQSKRNQLVPSPISPVTAQIAAIWYKDSTAAHLEIEVESTGSLMNGYCSENGRINPHPVKKLRLIGDVAEPQAIKGIWVSGENESDGYITKIDGTFRLQWLAGGTSKIPIPGPRDIKATIRMNQSVLLQWTAMPGASKYDIYFGKSPKIEPHPRFAHVESDKPFVALEVHGNFPIYVIATSTIEGKETEPSEVITVAPQNPKAKK